MKKYNARLDLSAKNSLSVLLKRVIPHSTILEFGPAYGRMTKYLKENLSCRIYGVEIDKKAANISSQYAEKVLVDNIENYQWEKEFKNLKFDFVIFADVLEHLYNPQEVLSRIKKFLKENGKVLISIPNIAHNSIIMGLLKNEFNYHPLGLLDNTHIRFFTEKTFEQLVEKLGYNISYKDSIIVPPENTEFCYSYEKFPIEISKFLRDLEWGEKYQLIYELELEMEKNNSSTKNKETRNIEFFNSLYSQLYIDKGKGFNEQDSIKKNYDKNGIIEFVLGNESVKNLRFDPLNDYVIVKLNEIELNENFSFIISTNAILVENNVYYFLAADPQIFISFDREYVIDKLTFRIDYISIGDKVIYLINEKIREEIAKKEEQIKSLREEIAKKEEQIKSLREEIAMYCLSDSWKITRPLRKIKKAFKHDK